MIEKVSVTLRHLGMGACLHELTGNGSFDYLIFSETISRLERYEWFQAYPGYPLLHRG